MNNLNLVRSLSQEEINDLIENYDLFKLYPEEIIIKDGNKKTIVFHHPGNGELVQITLKEKEHL